MPLSHLISEPTNRHRTTRWLVLLMSLALSGCTSWPTWDIDSLRGEEFDDEMAEYGAELRRSKSDKESRPGLFTTRGRQIEKNLGY